MVDRIWEHLRSDRRQFGHTEIIQKKKIGKI